MFDETDYDRESERDRVPDPAAKKIVGCQFKENNKTCGETHTLQIIKEFKALYEDRLKKIATEGGEESYQAKLRLQNDWIRDLTEQNEMLVRVVGELEHEATERVAMLEKKLKASAKNGLEVMKKYRDFDISLNLDETFQRLDHLQSDVNNLVEFIKRVRDEEVWSTEGLQFYEVNCADLFGSSDCCPPSKRTQALLAEQMQLMSQQVQRKDEIVKDLQNQLNRIHEQKQLGDITQQIRKNADDYAALKKSMLDMRDALTAEVADKHDVILSLRRDLQQLEEQCRQADKQTLFKDDIIKELRKEIKQLKQQKRLLEKAQSPVSQFLPIRPKKFYCIPRHPQDYCPYMVSKSPTNDFNKLHTTEKKLSAQVNHNTAQDSATERPRCNQAIIYIQNDCPELEHTDNTKVSRDTNTENFVTRDNCEQSKRSTVLSLINFTPQEYVWSKNTKVEEKSQNYPKIVQEYPQMIFSRKSPLRSDIINRLSPHKVERQINLSSSSRNQSNFCNEHECVSQNVKYIAEKHSMKLQKQRSKLTSGVIQMNCDGNIESIGDVQERFISAPSHIPVKTFVYNLEATEHDVIDFVRAEKSPRKKRQADYN